MAKSVDIKNEKYQNAIRLKYSDFTYSEIAQLLKVSHVSVKRWFRLDGLLKEEYERYEKERNKVRDKETDTVLMKHAETASKMLVSLMGAKSDAMKFRAAKTILDFVRGPAGSRDSDYSDEEYRRSSRQISEILEKYKNKKTVGN
jgi:transposase